MIHTANTAVFEDVVAVLEAIAAPKRELSRSGISGPVAAFTASFSVD